MSSYLHPAPDVRIGQRGSVFSLRDREIVNSGPRWDLEVNNVVDEVVLFGKVYILGHLLRKHLLDFSQREFGPGDDNITDSLVLGPNGGQSFQ